MCLSAIYAKKPFKYGLKAFSRCDARTFYKSNMQVYLGKNQHEAAPQIDNSAKSVVLRLIGPINKTDRNIIGSLSYH